MVHLSFSRPTWLYLVIAILLATYPLLLGRFYLVGDMHDVFLPLEDFFHRELLAGRLPVWNPDMAWGFPVIASAQLGFFYPLLLALRLLPPPIYLPLILVGHLVALALGTYQFARHQAISRHGAIVTALCMTLSSFVFQHITHLNIIVTLAWLPWQFLAMKRLSLAPTLKNQTLAAITLGLPFVAGHLHVPFLLTLTSLAYFLSSASGSVIQCLQRIIPVLIFAAGLAAVQLFPTAELVQYSSRGEGGDFALERANQLSWPLYHLPTVVFPRFFGSDSTYWGKRLEVEYGIFIGTLPLLLALSSLRVAWRHHRFFVLAAGIGFLLALGNFSPFRLLGLEPSLWYFSAPARWLLVYTFAGSILAGIGFDYLIATPQKLRRNLRILLIILTLSVLLYNALAWTLPATTPERLTAYLANQNVLGERPASYYEEKFASLIISLRGSGASLASPYTWLPLAIVAALTLTIYHRQAPRIAVGLITVELILVAATSTPTLSWKTILTPPTSISALPSLVKERQTRIFSVPPEGDTGLILTNPATRPDLNERLRMRELLLPGSHTLFNIAGSTWPASLDLQSHTEALASLTPEELNIGAVITMDPAGEIDVRALTPEPRAALVSATSTTTEPYPTNHPTELRWNLDLANPAQLIIRDTFYPGWQATIDGKPSEITVYKNVFRALSVPSGSHTVTMFYRPTALYWGLAISILTTLIVAGLWLSPFFQRMRR